MNKTKIDELKIKKTQSDFLESAFSRRYSTKPTILSANSTHYSLRQFEFLGKTMLLVEYREKIQGETTKVLVEIDGKEFMFKSYLEAEVTIADALSSLAEEILCQPQ